MGCGNSYTIRAGTSFMKARMTIMEQLKVVYHYFVRNYNSVQASNEIKEMAGLDQRRAI
jgi:hypothetical protein